MSKTEGFTFSGTGTLSRIDRFTSKAGKEIITLIFEQGGQWPQTVPVKVFGRLVATVSDLKQGDVVTVTGKLGGRDFNGRVYGDSIAETIEPVSSQPAGKDAPPVDDDPGSFPF